MSELSDSDAFGRAPVSELSGLSIYRPDIRTPLDGGEVTTFCVSETAGRMLGSMDLTGRQHALTSANSFPAPVVTPHPGARR